MRTSVYLSDFECPEPDFEKTQKQTFQWLQKAYRRYQSRPDSEQIPYEKLLARVGVSESQIGRRGYFLKDYQDHEIVEGAIFKSENFLGISERQREFLKITESLFDRIYQNRKAPDQVVHVTCTGYISPSAAQRWAARSSPETIVTHSYHMGCYGAFPALRIAQGFALSEGSLARTGTLDIVHTELCTLHLNPRDPSLEQILVQTLFSDGAAVYRLSLERPSHGFEIRHLTEILIPQTESAMSWDLAETGFAMTLSKDVPALISQNIRQGLEIWEKQSGLAIRTMLKDSIVAVHPGGPKIIDLVRDILELREDQVGFSRKVLFEKGNMSSATVPHIWAEILKSSEVPSGSPVISMAFGPGLTLSLAVFEKL